MSSFSRFGIVVAAAACALVAGCNVRLEGDGVYLEEQRNLSSVAGIRIEDGVAALVTVAPDKAQAVTVIGDQNLVPHIDTEVEPAFVGTATVPIVHVSVSERYHSTVPPTVVLSVPSFRFVDARDGSAVQVSSAADPAFTGERLYVTLATAALDASDYPVSGASVALSGSGTAKLRSSGPVVGSVSGQMQLVNSGTGECDVSVSGSATVECPASP